MANVRTPTVDAPAERLNVADRLARVAGQMPDAVAAACPRRFSPGYPLDRRGTSGATYAVVSFAELDADATRLGRGLLEWGVGPGTRLALLVRPGIEFVTLVFALLRAGVTIILIDPGLGRRNLIRCLAEAEPDGFVAVARAQAVRTLLRRKFPLAKWNVTVGRRWFWGGLTLEALRQRGDRATRIELPPTHADAPAAIIFTSGSTGPPKGVLYTQRMFDTQVAEIQSTYGIEPGGVDLSCFPLFALFNSAMGVTTVLPQMDFSRPAAADPRQLLAAANDWQATQAFASPAVWRKLSGHCGKTGARVPSLRQIFSCGAPVPADVLRDTLAVVAPGAKMHTPYGATECLPVATIEAAEVLGETAARTNQGAGVCVGRRFDSIEWRVIRITDASVATIDDADELPPGEIGELVVRGPQASPLYVTRPECNAEAKITDWRAGSSSRSERAGSSSTPAGVEDDPARIASHVATNDWHRLGDVGYLDDRGRFWYCGRKSQRVETAQGPLFTECVEAVFNRHPDVELSALVGIGQAGDELPVITLKFKSHVRTTRYTGRDAFAGFGELAPRVFPATTIGDWMDFEEMPVDVRHNAKIDRAFLREGTVLAVLAEPDLFPPEIVARARLIS